MPGCCLLLIIDSLVFSSSKKIRFYFRKQYGGRPGFRLDCTWRPDRFLIVPNCWRSYAPTIENSTFICNLLSSSVRTRLPLLVYYPLGRSSKLFYPNLALYLFSTLLRGLAGGFIFLILFELVFSFKRSNWSLFRIAFLSLVLLSPFIYETRKLIRALQQSTCSILQQLSY